MRMFWFIGCLSFSPFRKTQNLKQRLHQSLALQYIYHHGMVWYGMVWYGMVWYGMVWYGMVWYGMVWYGMVWYGMVWYGMVWYGIFIIIIIITNYTFTLSPHYQWVSFACVTFTISSLTLHHWLLIKANVLKCCKSCLYHIHACMHMYVYDCTYINTLGVNKWKNLNTLQNKNKVTVIIILYNCTGLYLDIQHFTKAP